MHRARGTCITDQHDLNCTLSFPLSFSIVMSRIALMSMLSKSFFVATCRSFTWLMFLNCLCDVELCCVFARFLLACSLTTWEFLTVCGLQVFLSCLCVFFFWAPVVMRIYCWPEELSFVPTVTWLLVVNCSFVVLTHHFCVIVFWSCVFQRVCVFFFLSLGLCVSYLTCARNWNYMPRSGESKAMLPPPKKCDVSFARSVVTVAFVSLSTLVHCESEYQVLFPPCSHYWPKNPRWSEVFAAANGFSRSVRYSEACECMWTWQDCCNCCSSLNVEPRCSDRHRLRVVFRARGPSTWQHMFRFFCCTCLLWVARCWPRVIHCASVLSNFQWYRLLFGYIVCWDRKSVV